MTHKQHLKKNIGIYYEPVKQKDADTVINSSVSGPSLFPTVQPADGRSYPIGQRPQSAGRQDVAEEGNWTTAPRGGATHAATERI